MKSPLSIGAITRRDSHRILENAERLFGYEKNANLLGFKDDDVRNLMRGGNISPDMARVAKFNIRAATSEQLDKFIEDLLKVRGNLLKSVKKYLDNKKIRTKADILGLTDDEKREILDYATDCAVNDVNHGSRLSPDEERYAVRDQMITLLEKNPKVLQRPNGSSKHHMTQYINEKFAKKEDVNEYLDFSNYQSFVVEHDWYAAFVGTPDFDGDEFPPLPFEKCCFEFIINSVRVLAFVGTSEDGIGNSFLSVGYKGHWYGMQSNWETGKLVPGSGVFDTFSNTNLIQFIRGQIRAVCIMLDAEVAVREVRRVSEKLNRARVRLGKTPLKDFHVVSLARKFRADLPGTRGEAEHARKRCHWRRGHWRHYADHKTWIKWMLVGDPALGFVEKEYRA